MAAKHELAEEISLQKCSVDNSLHIVHGVHAAGQYNNTVPILLCSGGRTLVSQWRHASRRAF